MIDIFCDAETYFDTQYSITKMPTADYVRDDRFECFGWAAGTRTSTMKWMSPDKFRSLLTKARLTDKPIRIIAHNTRFDGSILVDRMSWHYPTVWSCTVSMGRAILGPKVRNFSLDELAKYYGFEPKKQDALQKGKTWAQHTVKEKQLVAEYAEHDGVLARDIFFELEKEMPADEMKVLDWVLRMMLQPRLDLCSATCQKVIDDENLKHHIAWSEYMEVFEEYYDRNPAFAVQKMDDLRSRVKFAKMLRQMGVEPPMKRSKTRSKKTGKHEMTFAFAKDDRVFVNMVGHEHPPVGKLVAAKLACTSTALLRRGERMFKQAKFNEDWRAQNPNEPEYKWPVPLNYSGAVNTHRLSGCVVADTIIKVLDPVNGVCDKRIVDVLPDDLVWDGEFFVPHDGVVFSGYKEVIGYAGLEATADHVVFLEDGTECRLDEARDGGATIQSAGIPGEEQANLARRMARGFAKWDSASDHMRMRQAESDPMFRPHKR